MPVKIKINGKTYNSISDALKIDEWTDLIAQGVIEEIYKKIQPYANEINRTGGTVNIEWKNNQLNITGENVKEDLLTMINKAISQ